MEGDKNETVSLLEESRQSSLSLKKEVAECRRAIEESVCKEKEHQTSLARMEKEISVLREENEMLSSEKMKVVGKCEELKEIYDFVMTFKEKSRTGGQ